MKKRLKGLLALTLALCMVLGMATSVTASVKEPVIKGIGEVNDQKLLPGDGVKAAVTGNSGDAFVVVNEGGDYWEEINESGKTDVYEKEADSTPMGKGFMDGEVFTLPNIKDWFPGKGLGYCYLLGEVHEAPYYYYGDPKYCDPVTQRKLKLTPELIGYTIKYKDGGNVVDGPKFTVEASSLTTAGAISTVESQGFTKDGYKATGWKLDDGREIEAGAEIAEIYETLIAEENTVIAEPEPGHEEDRSKQEIPLTAIWDKGYTIKYDLNKDKTELEGEAPTSQGFFKSDKNNDKSIPTFDAYKYDELAYTFDWNTKPDGGGETIALGEPIEKFEDALIKAADDNGVITLYAQRKNKEYDVKYFDAEADPSKDEPIKTGKLDIDDVGTEKLLDSDDPKIKDYKPGYKLIGWEYIFIKETEDGTVEERITFDPGQEIDRDIFDYAAGDEELNLYARWEKDEPDNGGEPDGEKPYTLKYNANKSKTGLKGSIPSQEFYESADNTKDANDMYVKPIDSFENTDQLGYSFTWNTKADGKGETIEEWADVEEVEDTLIKAADKNNVITLYAQRTMNTYKINYFDGDPDDPDTKPIDDQKITAEDIDEERLPDADDDRIKDAKPGYILIGWEYIDRKTGEERVFKPGQKIDKDMFADIAAFEGMALYAIWEKEEQPTEPPTEPTEPTEPPTEPSEPPTAPTEPTEPENDDASGTGDSFSIMPWLTLATAAALGAVAMASRRRTEK